MNTKKLVLPIYIDRCNSELIKILKDGNYPFELNFLYFSFEHCRLMSIHPDDVDLYLEDKEKYFQILKDQQATLYRKEMLDAYPGSEEKFSIWEKLWNQCVGKNKDGKRCKMPVIIYRKIDDFPSFLKYFYVPNNFCKKHKKQIPLIEKQKIALSIHKEESPSFASTSRLLDVDVTTVKNWVSSNQWKKIYEK